jgi:hypothetical protein
MAIQTNPSVKIDHRHRVIAVRLAEGDIAWTDQLDDTHLVDVAADGRAIALDIMTLDDHKIDAMAERFGFREQIPAIKAATQSAMAPTVAAFGKALEFQGTRESHASAGFGNTETCSEPLIDTIVGFAGPSWSR